VCLGLDPIHGWHVVAARDGYARELGVVYGINHSLCGSSLAGRSRHVVDETKASERMTALSNASSVDVLRGMTIDDQKMLAHIAKRRRLRAGDFVYTQGDPAQHFYIVKSGRVRVFYQTPAASRRSPIVVPEISLASLISRRAVAESHRHRLLSLRRSGRLRTRISTR
jgi:hypothetical protein